MGWLEKLINAILASSDKQSKHKKKKHRYVPGGMDKFFSKDLDQPSKMFRRAFGDHYDDDDEDSYNPTK